MTKMPPGVLTAGAGQSDIAALAANCAREVLRYHKGTPSTTRYCYALFRHALVERDDQAWSAIYECYGALVRGWASRAADDPADVEELVDAAFLRLWKAVDGTRFDGFPDVQRLLQFLKLCVRTAALDQRRARAYRAHEVSLDQALTAAQEGSSVVEPPAADDVEGETLDADARRAFWDVVQRYLHDSREALMIRLSFVEALPPREICRREPEHFPTVDAVYQLKFKVLERLRQSPEVQQWGRGLS